MKVHRFIIVCFFLALFCSCADQLEIKNPNQPTPASASSESGLVALAQGTIYKNGFTSNGNKYYDGVVGAFYNGVIGFHELMGDVVAAEAANTYMNNLSAPDVVVLDNGVQVNNPNSPNTQKALLRSVNQNAQQGQNPLFLEWTHMYQLNNAANAILEALDKTQFTGDATAKNNAVIAWANFWKGIAYSRIGSMYVAGLIINTSGKTNGKYLGREAILSEAGACFDKAVTAINASGAQADFNAVLSAIIPDYFQTGLGAVPLADQWKRNINTLKARNILVNTPLLSLSAAQWAQILALVNDGLRAGDPVFAGGTNANADIFSPANYNVAARSVGANASGGTFKISERFIQEFNPTDKRFLNNFRQFPVWVGNSDRGNAFNTRWAIKDGGNGLAGTLVYCSRTPGAGVLYLGASYEENELMKAEAKLATGDLAGCLESIQAVRNHQGAGLDPLVSSNLLEVAEALRRERRIALAFRGLAFYDARRIGYLDNGRSGAVVISKDGKYISNNSTIKYGYMDYWDVPDNELALNPAEAGSAATKNPK